MSLRDTIDTVGDSLRSFLEGLTPRDRALFGVMVGALLLAIGWFVVSAMQRQTKGLETQLASAAQAQLQVNALMAQYTEVAGEVAGLDARLAEGAGFSPASWLEQLGNQQAITGNIKSIQERGTETRDYFEAQKVEVTIDDVDLRQLVTLLHTIQEAPQAIRVNDLRVKTARKERSLLDVRIELAVLKPLGGV